MKIFKQKVFQINRNIKMFSKQFAINFQRKTIYFVFIFLMCVLDGQAQQYNNILKRRDTESKIDASDPTKGLSDAEIEMALDDLSLSDLGVLSKLIDRPNAPDYDYVDYDSRNYALGPPRDHTFDDNRIDDEVNKNYYDDIDEPPRDARNLMYYKMSRQNVLPMSDKAENQRTKRENVQETKQFVSVDDEYIRQLENSFPRDQEQNNDEESGDKKEHIRVKRD